MSLTVTSTADQVFWNKNQTTSIKPIRPCLHLRCYKLALYNGYCSIHSYNHIHSNTNVNEMINERKQVQSNSNHINYKSAPSVSYLMDQSIRSLPTLNSLVVSHVSMYNQPKFSSTLPSTEVSSSLRPIINMPRISLSSTIMSPADENGLNIDLIRKIHKRHLKLIHCRHPHCKLQVYAGGFCLNHGSTYKCEVSECKRVARCKGLCVEHGGRYLCKIKDCEKYARRGGYCVRHGGGLKCTVDGCTKTAQTKGLCYSHGGGKRCMFPDCKQAPRNNGYCMKHVREVLRHVIIPK